MGESATRFVLPAACSIQQTSKQRLSSASYLGAGSGEVGGAEGVAGLAQGLLVCGAARPGTAGALKGRIRLAGAVYAWSVLTCML